MKCAFCDGRCRIKCKKCGVPVCRDCRDSNTFICLECIDKEDEKFEDMRPVFDDEWSKF